jgi:hypothetical protein
MRIIYTVVLREYDSGYSFHPATDTATRLVMSVWALGTTIGS